jgi:hypothetical protein
VVFTYLCNLALLGLLEDPDQFWWWKGNCVVCRKQKQGIKALFCANFSTSQEGYPPCKKVWCRSCYRRAESDNFQINELKDEDNRPMYDCKSDAERYKCGIDGAQFMTPFQCDLCIFRNLYKRNPRVTIADKENLDVIRRMNLDAMWSREPSTIEKNLRTLSNLILTCETSGFNPQ